MFPKVLVISYFFPPIGGAGVQRTLKFVRYLPEFGYEPVILSTRSRHYPATDQSLTAEIPSGTHVVRAADPGVLRLAAMALDYIKMQRLRAVAAWPDEAGAWIPAALVSALRAVCRHRPSAIFSSAPPFSSHLIAWMTARATGLPWVADFRDEFSANPHAERASDALDRLNAMVERRVVADAARVVTVADYFWVEGAMPGSDTRVTIVNGVDDADMASLSEYRGSRTFQLSFVGTLYGERDLLPVTSALRRLAVAGTVDAERCELRIVGSMWLPTTPDAGRVPVFETGYVSHACALEEMRQASVLVFYAPSSSPAPSGKIFEYLASGRPVLCVARRDNLAFRLVQDWNAGICVEPGNASGIDAAIAELYRGWEAGALSAPTDVRDRVFQRYSRRKLTGVLATTLDSAIADYRRDARRK